MARPIDYARPVDCDVAIVGAEMSAMVAGAILARHGRRVVVVDSPPVTGGRGGSVPYRGYWLDCGHRLGSDLLESSRIARRAHPTPHKNRAGRMTPAPFFLAKR